MNTSRSMDAILKDIREAYRKERREAYLEHRRLSAITGNVVPLFDREQDPPRDIDPWAVFPRRPHPNP